MINIMSKYIFFILLHLWSDFAQAQDITILQVNAGWNQHNDLKIKSVKGINEVKKMKGIKEVIILKNKNDEIPKIINNAQRPAYVISEAGTFHQALKIAQNGASKIKFQME